MDSFLCLISLLLPFILKSADSTIHLLLSTCICARSQGLCNYLCGSGTLRIGIFCHIPGMILSCGQCHQRVIGIDGRQVLPIVAVFCTAPCPINRCRHQSQEAHQLVDSVLFTHAIVSTGTEREIVSGVNDIFLAVGTKSIGIELFCIGKSLHVSRIDGWKDECTARDLVVVGQWIGTVRHLRYHRCRRTVPQNFFDNLTCEGHLIDHIPVKGLVESVAAEGVLLGSDTGEDVRSVGHEGGGPHEGRGGSILAGE